MTLLITGLSLSFIAIGVLFYFNRQLKRTLKLNNKALLALQHEFTQYQISQDKMIRKDITTREIRFDRVAKCIKKNEDAILAVNKKMPNEIKKCIKHIELSR